MQRIVELRVRISPIELGVWFPEEQDALRISFERKGIKGTIHLNLDRKSEKIVDWEFEEDGSPFPILRECNRIIVRVEGKVKDETTEREFMEVVQQLTAEYVNKFLSFVRVEMGQYWVRSVPVGDWQPNYFTRTTDAKWIEAEGESDVRIRPLGARGPIWEPEEPFEELRGRSQPVGKAGWAKIHNYIEQDVTPDLAKDLTANAKRYLEEGSYRMAVVEAITALEVKLESFVKGRCIERGISSKKFKATDHKLGIADYLKVLLPLVLRTGELDSWIQQRAASVIPPPWWATATDKERWEEQWRGLRGQELIDRCIHLNSLRNDIVHEGKKPASAYEVQQGIEGVELLLAFIEDVSKQEWAYEAALALESGC